MRTLFDINILIALFDPRHVHHDRAHSWWAHNRKSGWASCPLTQNGFVRVVSQSGYPNAIATPEAIRLMTRAVAQQAHEFWPDDVSLTDVDRFQPDRILGPKQVTDLYLLSLASRNGGRLATFDRTIPASAVLGANQSHLVVV